MSTTTTEIATTLAAAYAAAVPDWTDLTNAYEITYEVYIEAMEIVPPVYGPQTETKRGRFWLDEAYTHNNRGNAICLECWESRETGKYFCRLSECLGYRN